MLYVFDLFIGFTLAFHIICFWKQTKPYQIDIQQQGYVRAFLFISVAWFFNATIILLSIRKGIVGAVTYLFPRYWNDIVGWWNMFIQGSLKKSIHFFSYCTWFLQIATISNRIVDLPQSEEFFQKKTKKSHQELLQILDKEAGSNPCPGRFPQLGSYIVCPVDAFGSTERCFYTVALT